MAPKDLAAHRAPAWNELPDLDLYMDQVIGFLEKQLSFFYGEEKVLTSTMINNYVKGRLLPPPVNKRYGRQHLARLYQICILKSFMQLSDAGALLSAVWEGLSPEAAHERFCRSLDRAVAGVFSHAVPPAEKKGAVDRALDAACVAAACILQAKILYRDALPLSAPAAAPKKKARKASGAPDGPKPVPGKKG